MLLAIPVLAIIFYIAYTFINLRLGIVRNNDIVYSELEKASEQYSIDDFSIIEYEALEDCINYYINSHTFDNLIADEKIEVYNSVISFINDKQLKAPSNGFCP